MDITAQVGALQIPKHRKTHVFVMDYILINPKSSKLWKKLVQSCKWFCDKNPIVVIPCLHYGGFYKINGISTCSTQHYNDVYDCPIKLINVPFKLWVTELLLIEDDSGAAAKYLILHIYKCDAQDSDLFDQVLTVDEFAFLARKVLDPIFDIWVLDENKKAVSFEKILESLPQIQSIS